MKTNRGKIMVATSIETRAGWTRMVYHNTCVAEYRPTSYLDPNDPRAGRIVRLNTGGYYTKTTKKRMNQFAEMFDLPFRVYQEKGEWFVLANEQETRLPFEDSECEFLLHK